jgi:hypothetical protein
VEFEADNRAEAINRLWQQAMLGVSPPTVSEIHHSHTSSGVTAAAKEHEGEDEVAQLATVSRVPLWDRGALSPVADALPPVAELYMV